MAAIGMHSDDSIARETGIRIAEVTFYMNQMRQFMLLINCNESTELGGQYI